MWDGMSRSEEHADAELTTAVLSAIDAGVIVLDDEGAIQRANETVRNKLGLSEANIGISASEALPLGEYLTQYSYRPVNSFQKQR